MPVHPVIGHFDTVPFLGAMPPSVPVYKVVQYRLVESIVNELTPGVGTMARTTAGAASTAASGSPEDIVGASP